MADNRYEDVILKKKFHKTERYYCCFAPRGNTQKYSKVRYCCTFPQVWRRIDKALNCKKAAAKCDDDVCLEESYNLRCTERRTRRATA